MWEVLAPIVRWPLYSPARFIAVVVVALAGVFVVGEVNDDPASVAAATGSASPTPARVDASPPVDGADRLDASGRHCDG